MRSLFVAAAVLMLAPAVSHAEVKYQIRDTSDLVAVCDSAAAPDAPTALAFCHGFLAGAAHYHFASVPEESRFVCAPDPLPTRSDVMSGFVNWARDHAQHNQDPAVESLFRYLALTYPCS